MPYYYLNFNLHNYQYRFLCIYVSILYFCDYHIITIILHYFACKSSW